MISFSRGKPCMLPQCMLGMLVHDSNYNFEIGPLKDMVIGKSGSFWCCSLGHLYTSLFQLPADRLVVAVTIVN